ncbi:MAG: hypothetical protein QUV02_02230 [Maricaulis sp.]|uniref:hypothetical protein n=1 Tax=Maricaulis sp. TaxID=1486257 RepID=UPI0026215050|nr:hypothetical protein [Maricaulis sp.]MDM7983239.1 hypothetical protein [Maricaulis sp.]
MSGQLYIRRLKSRGVSVLQPAAAAVTMRVLAAIGIHDLPTQMGISTECANLLVSCVLIVVVLAVFFRCVWARMMTFEVAVNNLKNITPGEDLDERLSSATDRLERFRKLCTTSVHFFSLLAVLIGEYKFDGLVRWPDLIWLAELAPVLVAAGAAIVTRQICKTGGAYHGLIAAVRNLIDALTRSGGK